MQINSANSPAFGCGACAQMHKILRRPVYNNPKTADYIADPVKLEKASKKFIQAETKYLKSLRPDLTHGQAASQLRKELLMFA